MRFGGKEATDTLGRTVEGEESGKRLTAAELAAGNTGSVVWKDRPEAKTSGVLAGRDAAGEGLGGAVVFGVEGFEAPRADDADVGFSHRHRVAQFGNQE